MKSERTYFMWIVTPIQTIYLTKQIKFKFNAKNKEKKKKREEKIRIRFDMYGKGKKRQSVSHEHNIGHRNSDETTARNWEMR